MYDFSRKNKRLSSGKGLGISLIRKCIGHKIGMKATVIVHQGPPLLIEPVRVVPNLYYEALQSETRTVASNFRNSGLLLFSSMLWLNFGWRC